MVLIISDANDLSTCDVIDWLWFYNINFLVITPKDKITLNKIHEDGELEFFVNSQLIDTSSIKGVWYRRGNLFINKEPLIEEEMFFIKDKFNEYISKENYKLINYIHYKFFSKNYISNYLTSDLNKMLILDRAKNCGLAVPDTIVATTKQQLLDFYNKTNEIITKTVFNGIFFGVEDIFFCGYTEDVDINFINSLRDTCTSPQYSTLLV